MAAASTLGLWGREEIGGEFEERCVLSFSFLMVVGSSPDFDSARQQIGPHLPAPPA